MEYGEESILGKKIARTVVNLLRNAEIRYLDATLVIDKNVGAFDVSVYDISFMQITQTSQNLTNEVLHKGFLKRAIIAQKRCYRSTGDIFQKDVEVLLIYG